MEGLLHQSVAHRHEPTPYGPPPGIHLSGVRGVLGPQEIVERVRHRRHGRPPVLVDLSDPL
jgi:hypothetical protein